MSSTRTVAPDPTQRITRSGDTPAVLVAERLADAGVELLADRFRVDVGLGWSREELIDRITDYEALIVRSATQVDAELISKGERLRVIGRAGTGVDNVDVDAATRHGVVVVNAPDANSIAAAEHTLALMLALARNVPQAHGSLVGGAWERGRFKGTELSGKVLGVVGLGRIGRLVAERAIAFGMKVLAFDPYVGPRRFEEVGARRTQLSEILRRADFVTLHLPSSAETRGLLDRRAFGEMRSGIRIINTARGDLIDEEALFDALEAGRVAGAALDVFAEEPVTDHRLFGGADVIVTPHLGASTAEAQTRAGAQIAEQVAAALDAEFPPHAVNLPRVDQRARERLRPILELADQLARISAALCRGPGIDRLEVTLAGKLADLDPEPVVRAALRGLLRGRDEGEVTYVNATILAADRDISVSEARDPDAGGFTELLRVAVVADDERAEVAGTMSTGGWPHLVEAWGQLFSLELAPYLTFVLYRDQPGMIGRVGARFGEHDVNISSAAVGRQPERDNANGRGQKAVMVITTDRPVPDQLLDEIASMDGSSRHARSRSRARRTRRSRFDDDRAQVP